MSNGQKGRENERYENLARKEPIVMARFKIRSDQAQEMWSNDWDSVFLMNISAGGIFFYYTKDLAIGTLLDLKIYVPNAIIVINCVGKVIRIDKPRHHTSMFGIAIKFTEIGELEKEIINTTLQEFLEYKIKNF
jgi:Tfp pilus assembly protein PilZ